MGKIIKKESAEASESREIFMVSAYKADKPTLEIVNLHLDWNLDLSGGNPRYALNVANLHDCIKPRERIGYWKKGKPYMDTDMDGKATVKEAEEYLKYDSETIRRTSPYADHDADILSAPILTPHDSNDAFRIRYMDASSKGKGKISVQVKSYDPENPKSPYQDSVTVDLYEVSESGGYVLNGEGKGTGIFVSQPSILVPNKKLDSHAVNGELDNSVNDTTFLAMPGNRIEISYTNPNGETLKTTASVPVRQELYYQPVIPLNKNRNPIVNQQEVDRQIAIAKEIYAPAGVRIKTSAPLIVRSINPSRGFKNDEEIFQAIQRARMETAPTLINTKARTETPLTDFYTDKEITIIFWDKEELYDPSYKTNNAIGVAWSNVDASSPYWSGRNAFILAVNKEGKTVGSTTIGHETFHTVVKRKAKDIPGHDPKDPAHYNSTGIDHENTKFHDNNHAFDNHDSNDLLNLMHVPNISGDGIDGRQYLTDEQIDAFVNSGSSLLHNPPSLNRPPKTTETFAQPAEKPNGSIYDLPIRP
jgi:hypothetical protein